VTDKKKPMELPAGIKWVLEPSMDRLVIRVLERSSTTPSGIYLPEGIVAKDRATTGEVIAVSLPYKDNETGEEFRPYYKVGDILIFGRFTGTEIRIDGTTFIILRESDALARLKIEGEQKVDVELLIGEKGPVQMVDRD